MGCQTRSSYLTKENLKGFEKYKYSSVDTCVLSVYVMHPFWNRCIKYCPVWVAPNLLTFTGFLLTLLNFLVLSWYDYDFTSCQAVPRAAWICIAVSLFVAYTLDGMDGKQARRTGTSGPLGELFDHGLDSYSAALIPAFMYSIMGRHEMSPLRMFFVVWHVLINFYLTHFEKYNTGVLFLPWGYDFTMTGMVLALLMTGVWGPAVWNHLLPAALPIGLAMEVLLYTSATLTSQTVIAWNIYKSYRDRTGKMRPLGEALRPLVPLGALLLLSTAWVLASPNDILSRDPRAVYVLVGTVFSNITCRLIVSQMSGVRCCAWNSLLWVVCGAALPSLLLPLSLHRELQLLYAACLVTTSAHLHYGVGVVREMCAHFGIMCFRIKQDKEKL